MKEINKSDIECLDLIDPTLFEEKGHIFLTIISEISQRVLKAIEKKEITPSSNPVLYKKEWYHNLNKLAEGLPSLDGLDCDNSFWDDPEFIMHKGLKSVKSAFDLRKNFQNLIEFALKILDKKLFLIAFDDIDVNFKKGFPVLETLRKYLNCSKIITLIAGDFNLFSKAVRKHQWENLGKPLLKNEYDKYENDSTNNEYSTIVSTLENQYMQKVLPPSYRIYLNTLYEKVILNKVCDLKVKFDDKDEPKYIKSLYTEMLKALGIFQKNQQMFYISFLMNLPLRSQIHILNLYSQKENDENAWELEIVTIFITSLYAKHVDFSRLRTNPNYTTIAILKFLNSNNILQTNIQLQPITEDYDTNNSLFALSLSLTNSIKRAPYLIFDYFVRIAYLSQITSPIQGIKRIVNSDSKNLASNKIFEFDIPYRNIAGMISSVHVSSSKNSSGVFELKGTMERGKQKKCPNEKRIDEVENIARMAAARAVTQKKNGGITFYSFYMLFASIGDLLKEFQDKKQIEKDDIKIFLNKTCFIRDFEYSTIQYHIEEDNSSDSDYIDDPQYNNKKNDTKIDNLCTNLKFWVEKEYHTYNIAIHLLGKIATRFFKASSNFVPMEKLGDSMQQLVVIFLNSVLVEEARESKLTAQVLLSSDNPRNDPRIFCENYNKLCDLNHLNLFNFFAFCPLLQMYIKPQNLKSWFGKHIMDHCCDFSIYDELNQVHIKTNNSKNTFSFAKKNYEKIIKYFQDNPNVISYDYFMRASVDEIQNKLKGHFEYTPNPKAIRTFIVTLKERSEKRW